MKIVLHEMATYTHRQELAKALSSRGHEIAYLYCPSSLTPSRSSMCFTPGDKVTVIPIKLDSEFAKWQLLKRFLQERAYGARVASLIANLRPDLVISGNTPIEIQAAIQKMCRRSGTPFLFWLEDVYSIGVKSVLSKMPLIGDLIASRYALLERKVARQSEGIIAIADATRVPYARSCRKRLSSCHFANSESSEMGTTVTLSLGVKHIDGTDGVRKDGQYR